MLSSSSLASSNLSLSELSTTKMTASVLPNRSYFSLTADIPLGEADMLVLNSLHIEPDVGYGGPHFPQLEFVQHGCLASIVQAKHPNPGWSCGKESVNEG